MVHPVPKAGGEAGKGTTDDSLAAYFSQFGALSYSKNAPHLESAITLGVFVQMFATANCSGGTPKKVSNNILLDPSRKTIFRSTGEIGVSDELH